MIRKEHVKKIRLLDNSKNEVNLFGQLDVFKKKDIEIEAKASDLALLKGALQGDEGFSPYWTSTAGKDRQDVIVPCDFSKDNHYSALKTALSPNIRPVLEMQYTICDDLVNFGEYPQQIEPNRKLYDTLLELKNNNQNKTGRKFWLDEDHETEEYEYNGKKYVPVIAKNDNVTLSDGTVTKKGELYWVVVSPVQWLVDKKRDLLISVRGLLSNIRFWIDPTKKEYTDSNMCSFLDNKMLKDLTNFDEYNFEINFVKLADLDRTAKSVSGYKKGILKSLNNFKFYTENIALSSLNKKAIQDFIRRRTTIETMEDGELKTTLYHILYNNILDYDFKFIGAHYYPTLNQSLIKNVDLLLKAVQLKNNNFSTKVLTTFLNAVKSRVELLVKNNSHAILDMDMVKWLDMQSFFNDIYDIILMEDNKKIVESLKKFIVYDGRYNDLLIKLDVELGRYGEVKVAAR